MNRPRYRFLLPISLAIGLLSFFPHFSLGQTLQLNELKANYLEGFVDFISWHQSSRPAEVTIGVIGSDELVSHLANSTRQDSSDRTVNVIKFQAEDHPDEIDILFVGEGIREEWAELFRRCDGHSILIVGEEEGFVRQGGSIEFVVRRNRLRFIASTSNATKHGIKMSSKLLELALDQK